MEKPKCKLCGERHGIGAAHVYKPSANVTRPEPNVTTQANVTRRAANVTLVAEANVTRRGGRRREYETDAERQRAYRARRKTE